jgi:hypothetical protein
MARPATAARIYFRSEDRIICQGSQWYFQSREGDQGPFASREEAELELQYYIEAFAPPDQHSASVQFDLFQ